MLYKNFYLYVEHILFIATFYVENYWWYTIWIIFKFVLNVLIYSTCIVDLIPGVILYLQFVSSLEKKPLNKYSILK